MNLFDQLYESPHSSKRVDGDFSEKKITSSEEFRKYAHTLMKKAHGDKYEEKKTNEVVDGLLKDIKGDDYGEAIGRLQKSLG